MKKTFIVAICIVISLFIHGCSGRFIVTNRSFSINETSKTIKIYKNGYIDKFITSEGFFPENKEGVELIYFNCLDKSKNGKLLSGVDFTSRYDAIDSGYILIDFDRNIAFIDLNPSNKNYWLDLNGSYHIEFK